MSDTLNKYTDHLRIRLSETTTTNELLEFCAEIGFLCAKYDLYVNGIEDEEVTDSPGQVNISITRTFDHLKLYGWVLAKAVEKYGFKVLKHAFYVPGAGEIPPENVHHFLHSMPICSNLEPILLSPESIGLKDLSEIAAFIGWVSNAFETRFQNTTTGESHSEWEHRVNV